MGKGFDEYAPAYDAWFLENRNVLYSEINLVAHVLKIRGGHSRSAAAADSSKRFWPKSTVSRSPTASNRRKEWPKSPASGG